MEILCLDGFIGTVVEEVGTDPTMILHRVKSKNRWRSWHPDITNSRFTVCFNVFFRLQVAAHQWYRENWIPSRMLGEGSKSLRPFFS